MLQGLREIHALGRLHGDMRGPNVMITKDDKVGFTDRGVIMARKTDL